MTDTATPVEQFEVAPQAEVVAVAAPVVKAVKKRKRKKVTKPRAKKSIVDPIVQEASKQASAPTTTGSIPVGAASLLSEEGATDPCASVAPLHLLRSQEVSPMARRHFGIRPTATQVSMSYIPTGMDRFTIAFAGSLGAAALAFGTYAAWYWW